MSKQTNGTLGTGLAAVNGPAQSTEITSSPPAAGPVLVALDGSALAERAIPWAVQLAYQWSAPLLLVRVVAAVTYPVVSLPSAAMYDTLLMLERKDAVSYLENQVAALQTAHPHLIATSEVRSGDPALELLDAEAQHRAQVIVLTTHGRTGIQRWLRGSVADRVLRHGSIPLLLIESWGAPIPVIVPPGRGMHVLVPLDGSAIASQMLPHAARLAFGPMGQVTLLSVLEPQRQVVLDTAGVVDHAMEFTGEATPDAKAEAEHRLSVLSLELEACGTVAHSMIRVASDVASTIVETARQAEVDAIAMGTHGRGTIGRWLYGSVADRVTHVAPMPVLLIRPEAIPAYRAEPSAIPLHAEPGEPVVSS